MSNQGARRPAVHETANDREIRDQLFRQGFTPDEVEAAIESTSVRPDGGGASGSDGRLGYGLGLLAFVPVPGVSLVVAGALMAAVYPSQRRKGPLAAENARQAANWGLTCIAFVVALAAVTGFLVAIGTAGIDPGPHQISAVLPPVFGLIAFGVRHLLVCITGLVVCARGKVFGNSQAIRFLRA
jgi:hypothetical protein